MIGVSLYRTVRKRYTSKYKGRKFGVISVPSKYIGHKTKIIISPLIGGKNE